MMLLGNEIKVEGSDCFADAAVCLEVGEAVDAGAEFVADEMMANADVGFAVLVGKGGARTIESKRHEEVAGTGTLS